MFFNKDQKMDKETKKRIDRRIATVLPNHPSFIEDYHKGIIYLYDSSLFNNEDENLNKGIYNEPSKFRPLHDNELRMVREVERDHGCYVFFVIKRMEERGLTYWLYYTSNDYLELEENNYTRDKDGVIHPDVWIVDAGFQFDELPTLYTVRDKRPLGDIEGIKK